MLLEVLPHVRVVDENVDAMLAQMGCRADSGQHQQLWRAVCAGGHDHLSRRPRRATGVLDADRAPVLDQDAPRVRPGHNGEVPALADRLQERVRGAVAAPIADHRLGQRRPGHLGAVAVVDALHARRHGGSTNGCQYCESHRFRVMFSSPVVPW